MRVASLRLRLLATLVDATAAIGGLAAVVGLAIAAAIAYARVRGGDEDERDGEDPEEEQQQQRQAQKEQEGQEADECPVSGARRGELRQSPELRAALFGAGAGLAVAGRNWRGPGFRVVGLRRVDARTGGVVSVRSALIGVLFDQALQAAARPLFGSRARRERDRIGALGPQLRAVEREHASDPQARQRAVMEFYKANKVNPLAGCGWQLAGPLGTQLILALGSREGRTVRDRMTGTGVIVDR